MKNHLRNPLRKKCPYLELLWSVFPRIWNEFGEIRSTSPYSVQMWENTDQNNSEYGQCFYMIAASVMKGLTIFT